MIVWKKIYLGTYHASIDGKVVVEVKRIRDTGEPLWELQILNGTPYRTTASGREVDTFVTLSCAKQAFEHQQARVSA